MEYMFIAIIVVGITLYICYPFFAMAARGNLFEEDKENYIDQKKSDLEILEEDKLELYSAIKEIEFDYGLGKLSEEDFKELRHKYIYEASKVVSRIEELSNIEKASSQDSLEEEIKRFRTHVHTREDKIEEEIKKRRNKRTN
ncbi:MAG: hypothetical protein GWO07_08420 [Candidatus Dadabacteria bacterium]|nr:hypothetical protein [Candidatus Dadabacteria bacterium]NIS08770.1 hypothetical protein [Candidatus Dadabacteria bacterium]NIV42713.1 hypothetical protein [Candidatus Dadabacteria bacterium]NIX15456.1 hypothetical protein [Candidatus Dadabacteria bacterium]NIY22118.1 hypothetical protein [Candidatus Dadabacteria bacterium]